jgi:hypothetical protein
MDVRVCTRRRGNNKVGSEGCLGETSILEQDLELPFRVGDSY